MPERTSSSPLFTQCFPISLFPGAQSPNVCNEGYLLVFFVAAKPKALSADFVVDQGIPTQVSIGSGAEHVIKVYFILYYSLLHQSCFSSERRKLYWEKKVFQVVVTRVYFLSFQETASSQHETKRVSQRRCRLCVAAGNSILLSTKLDYRQLSQFYTKGGYFTAQGIKYYFNALVGQNQSEKVSLGFIFEVTTFCYSNFPRFLAQLRIVNKASKQKKNPRKMALKNENKQILSILSI